MIRENYLKQISNRLATLIYEVSLQNSISLFDINIISEDFFKDLLNIIFDYKLINLNIEEKNASSIDLVDIDKRIAIQVTSDNSASKIRNTIESFIRKGLYISYDRLIILTIAPKKRYRKPFQTNGKFIFNNKKDILSVQSLLTTIRSQETSTLKKIAEFLTSEFANSNDKIDNDDIEKIEDTVKCALLNYLDGCKSEYRYSSSDFIELTLKSKQADTGEISTTSISKLCNKLIGQHQVILKGIPGAGKSITLLQIADCLLHNRNNPIPVLVSLPLWAISTNDILVFLQENYKISLEHLEKLCKAGRLAFLMDGWNEIPINCIDKLSHLLKNFIRCYCKTPVIVTTRESRSEPPLTNAYTFFLEPLNNDERQEIIQKLCSSNYEKVVKVIENNLSLSEITKTPLFLIGLIKILKNDISIPVTRYEILNGLVIDAEKEHSASLSIPTGYNYSYYLMQIASDMTYKGVINTNETAILKSVALCSKKLFNEGIIGTIPEANNILSILYNHHLIIKPSIQPNSIRFIHQQFQEWFASEYLFYEVIDAFTSKNSEKIFNFCKEIINQPIWEEALSFLIEHLERDNYFDICANLLRIVMKIDLIFASQLSHCINDIIWNKIKKELSSSLCNWYNKPLKYAKECALSAMLITGKPDFSDIIKRLVNNSNQQIRLDIFRKISPFPVESLGTDWIYQFKGWPDEVREDFISEMMWGIYPSYLPFIEQTAKSDPCNSICVTAIEVLAQNGASDMLRNVLMNGTIINWADEAYIGLLRYLPKSIIIEISSNIKKALKNNISICARLKILNALNEINDSDITKLLKSEFQLIDPEEVKLMDSIKTYESFILQIYKTSSLWVKQFIIKMLLLGKMWDTKWVPYLSGITLKEIKELMPLVFDSNINISRYRLEVITKISNSTVVNTLIKIYMGDSSIVSITEEQQQFLLHYLRDLPLVDRIHFILNNYYSDIETKEIMKLINIVITFPSSDLDYRNILSKNLISKLRKLIVNWYNVLEEFPYCRADIAYLLGFIGNTKDISMLEEWILNEKNRVSISRQSWERQINNWREKGGEYPIRDATCYSNIYAAALGNVDSDTVTMKFLCFLDDPEYTSYASAYLVKTIYKSKGESLDIYTFESDYSNVFIRREELEKLKPNYSNSLECMYSKAIRTAILKIIDKSKTSGHEDTYSYNVFDSLVNLSLIGNEEILPLIYELASNKYYKWDIVRALNILVVRGFLLPGKKVNDIFTPITNEFLSNPYSSENNRTNLFQLCIKALLFSDTPNYGVTIIKRLFEDERNHRYEYMNLIKLMGLCKSDDAISCLLELGNNIDFIKKHFKEWILAISTASKEKTKEIIINFLSSINNCSSLNEIFIKEFMEYKSPLIEFITKTVEESDDFWKQILDFCINASTQLEKNIALRILEGIGTEEAAIIAYKLFDKARCFELDYYQESIINKCIISKEEADLPN
ncbi:MAG: SMEK domain-containing protein, partial [Clostridiaceae bacterium]